MARVHKATLIGLLFFLTGGVGLLAELAEHRTIHVFNGSVCVSLMVLGALLMAPKEVAAALKEVLGGLKELLPWKGGGTPPSPPPPTFPPNPGGP